MTPYKVATTFACTLIGLLLLWCVVDMARPNKPAPSPADAPLLTQSVLTQVPPAPSPASIEKLPVELSPHAIRDIVTNKGELDLLPLWERLGISAKLNGVWETPVTFDQCEFTCRVELHHINLDEQPKAEVVLGIHGGFENSRYLFFNRSGKGWRLLGHADHDFARYRQTYSRVVGGKGKRWFVIDGQTGSGTGFSEFHYRWFEVSQNGVREVLRVIAKGVESASCDFPQHRLASKFLNHQVAPDGTDVLTIEFSATWKAHCMGKNGRTLWRESVRAIYTKPPNTSSFSFNPQRSRIPEEKLKAIFSFSGINNETFLHYEFDNLTRLAQSKDKELNQWLISFLDRCQDSPEKQSLRRKLNTRF